MEISYHAVDGCKFTGWVDVDLTPHGKLEACKAGEAIKSTNVKIVGFRG